MNEQTQTEIEKLNEEIENLKIERSKRLKHGGDINIRRWQYLREIEGLDIGEYMSIGTMRSLSGDNRLLLLTKHLSDAMKVDIYERDQATKVLPNDLAALNDCKEKIRRSAQTISNTRNFISQIQYQMQHQTQQ